MIQSRSKSMYAIRNVSPDTSSVLGLSQAHARQHDRRMRCSLTGEAMDLTGLYGASYSDVAIAVLQIDQPHPLSFRRTVEKKVLLTARIQDSGASKRPIASTGLVSVSRLRNEHTGSRT